MLDYTKITFNELDDTDNNQYWIELYTQFTDADKLISLIPDYGKIKL